MKNISPIPKSVQVIKSPQLSLVLFFLLLVPMISSAALLKNIPQAISLPDHSVIHCFASGDEFFNYLHDENGFTLTFGTDGYLYYAIKVDGKLIPSAFRVNSVLPASQGIMPGNIISEAEYNQRRQAFYQECGSSNSSHAPHTGTFNNLAIFIRFSGETEFPELITYFDNLFNSVTPGANSMRSYYAEASYNLLTISTTFYPSSMFLPVVSYMDGHQRNYFQPYDATTNPAGYMNDVQKREREHGLLRDATNAVSGDIPPGLNIDADGDGKVDNVCYIIRGEPTSWSTLLWPHRWALTTYVVNINGKRVWDYNFQIESIIQSNGNGVLCHEMFHTIGAPDLYHYDALGAGLSPAGSWDLMEWNANPPQHMGAYMKHKYGGWIPTMPEISTTGYYTLNPLNSATSSNVFFRINSPNSTSEYFVVEYRRKTGTYDSSLPGSGMLIYRINTACNDTGNCGGNAWYNGTSILDEVYIYRPGGTTTVNGTINDANYSQLVGREVMDCLSDPSPFLAHGEAGGLHIQEIKDNAGTLSFLLLNNLPYSYTLNLPNTTGFYAALYEITLQNGFTTANSNSFRALVTECSTYNKTPVSSPVLTLNSYEVLVRNKATRLTNSYNLQAMGNLDINKIRYKTDINGHYLTQGEYDYVVTKEGAEVNKGTLLLK